MGHSYAGMVITGVADRMAQRADRPLACLVYVDAVVPRPGETWSSTHDADIQRQRRATIARDGVLAPPDPVIFGLAGTERDWVARRMHRIRRRLRRGSGLRPKARGEPAPRLHRLPLARTADDRRKPPARAQRAGWEVAVIETGHDPMVSAPEPLARRLLELAI